jgi:hypothetical protein
VTVLYAVQKDRNFLCGLFLILRIFFQYILAFIKAASATYPVRHFILLTLRAFDHTRYCKLPMGASVITSLFGYPSFWYCHYHSPPNKLPAVYFSSFFKAASRSSIISCLQSQFFSFKFVPQIGHKPLQSSWHKNFMGKAE